MLLLLRHFCLRHNNMKMTKKALDLRTLGKGIPTLNPGKAQMLEEACKWCLLTCCHDTGVEILTQYKGEEKTIPIIWDENDSDLQTLSLSYNDDDGVEFGAEALALLLVRECTDYTAIRRAANGTGIDYYLGKKRGNSKNFFSDNDARLEISGILKENQKNTVKTRVKKKLKQTKPTDGTSTVFVSVIEFSHPKSQMVLKDV